MVVCPLDGCCYFTNGRGDILRFDPQGNEEAGGAEGAGQGKVSIHAERGMRLDYFGKYDETQPGSMSYNWRQVSRGRVVSKGAL